MGNLSRGCICRANILSTKAVLWVMVLERKLDGKSLPKGQSPCVIGWMDEWNEVSE